MKKIAYFIFSVFLLYSCDLTEVPYTAGTENLKDAADGADQIIASIYNVFWSSYMMKKTYMEWIDMDHDHASAEAWVVSGAGQGNVTTHWGYNGNSDLFYAFYQIITRANFAIENVPSYTEISEEDLNQLLGEAYFLRAFAYFHLVRMYGPVPLRLKYITERDMARNPVSEVYESIVNDLKEADQLMINWGTSSERWGHANKTAVKLLLAKVYATMASGTLAGNVQMNVDIKGTMTTFTTDAVSGYESIDADQCYTQVEKLCTEVIAERGTAFDLRGNFQSIWGANNVRNNEFVWGIVGHDDFKTQHLNYYYAGIPFNGRAWAGMSLGLYNLYEVTDNRGQYGVFHYMKRSFSSTKYERFPNDATKYGIGPDGNATSYSNYSSLVFTTKWYIGDVTDPSPVTTSPGYSYEAQDVIMIRYVDAYLLRAEARNELNNPAGALADLDVVRDRAEASLKTGTTTDKTEIRSLVFQERALEYAQEFNRKFDLLRWGLYLSVMNTTGTVLEKYNRTISKVREPRSLLYAVPTTEIYTNKLFGPNNTGWQ